MSISTEDPHDILLNMAEQVGERREQKVRKPFPEDVVIYSPEMGELRAVALTTEPFQQRVQKGFERVKRLGAESRITILSEGSDIVYPPLALGGRHPDNDSDILLAHGASSTSAGISREFFVHNSSRLDRFSLIADLHFHPDFAPFSSPDLEVYDELLNSYGYDLRMKPNGYFGVFMPLRKGGEIVQLTLLMFNGPATSNEYQGADFTELTFGQQQEVLKASGMGVTVVELPVTKGKVQFDSLREKLLISANTGSN